MEVQMQIQSWANSGFFFNPELIRSVFVTKDIRIRFHIRQKKKG